MTVCIGPAVFCLTESSEETEGEEIAKAFIKAIIEDRGVSGFVIVMRWSVDILFLGLVPDKVGGNKNRRLNWSRLYRRWLPNLRTTRLMR